MRRPLLFLEELPRNQRSDTNGHKRTIFLVSIQRFSCAGPTGGGGWMSLSLSPSSLVLFLEPLALAFYLSLGWVTLFLLAACLLHIHIVPLPTSSTTSHTPAFSRFLSLYPISLSKASSSGRLTKSGIPLSIPSVRKSSLLPDNSLTRFLSVVVEVRRMLFLCATRCVQRFFFFLSKYQTWPFAQATFLFFGKHKRRWLCWARNTQIRSPSSPLAISQCSCLVLSHHFASLKALFKFPQCDEQLKGHNAH